MCETLHVLWRLFNFKIFKGISFASFFSFMKLASRVKQSSYRCIVHKTVSSSYLSANTFTIQKVVKSFLVAPGKKIVLKSFCWVFSLFSSGEFVRSVDCVFDRNFGRIYGELSEKVGMNYLWFLFMLLWSLIMMRFELLKRNI